MGERTPTGEVRGLEQQLDSEGQVVKGAVEVEVLHLFPSSLLRPIHFESFLLLEQKKIKKKINPYIYSFFQ